MEIARAAQVLLGTRHHAVRVLQAWGGEEGGTVAHTKDKMAHLLGEYAENGDLIEASDTDFGVTCCTLEIGTIAKWVLNQIAFWRSFFSLCVKQF